MTTSKNALKFNFQINKAKKKNNESNNNFPPIKKSNNRRYTINYSIKILKTTNSILSNTSKKKYRKNKESYKFE